MLNVGTRAYAQVEHPFAGGIHLLRHDFRPDTALTVVVLAPAGLRTTESHCEHKTAWRRDEKDWEA